jgi:NAD(P)-dependent dehydrogenase (short-subunit alcohol dehydrogenase family)
MSSEQTFKLAGKRILLVGATGVLGRTYAHALADSGARLALADRAESDVLELSKKLDATGIVLDVCDEQQVIAGVGKACAALGGLDGAVSNSAATGEGLLREGDAFAPFEDYPLAVWKKTIDVNLTGTFLVNREVGKAMRSSGGGSIVNVSSIYGVVGPDHRIYEGQAFKSFAGYSASKAGMLGLTRWLATWWGPHKVRVNCLTPGGVFNDHTPEFAAAYGNRTPLGRMAERHELVGMLIFLLSDASGYCTGQNYIVDGGFTAW